MMSAVKLEGLAYLSFFDDGFWFQVNYCFILATVAVGFLVIKSVIKCSHVEVHGKFQGLCLGVRTFETHQ